MEELIANLTEMTRVQTGRFRVNLEESDLAELARQVARTIEPLLERRGQQLVLELPDQPVEVLADPSRMQRCLLNLLGNAQKYGRQDGTIRLRLEQTDDAARFVIANDGPPASDVDRSRLLSSLGLTPADSPGDERKDGLGLLVACSIMELHGGCIWVETPSDSGAVIHIAMPAMSASRLATEPHSP